MSTQSTDLAITPKRLGLILIIAYCARCFWYRLKLKFRPPFDMFGGAIFKQMEQAQLATVAHFLAKDGGLPQEFDPFCDLMAQVEFPRSWRKFQHRLESGLLLYGEPDDICMFSDGSIAVIDHKTANPKGGDDPLLPMYRCQITGYAQIAEFGLKLGKVSKGGLFYWSADHRAIMDDPSHFYRSKKLSVPFVPRPLAIDIDYALLEAPLKEATRLWKASTPPDSRENCPDCKKLDALLAIEAEVQKLASNEDKMILARTGNSAWARDAIITRTFHRDNARRSALIALRNETADLCFSEGGVLLNWDDLN